MMIRRLWTATVALTCLVATGAVTAQNLERGIKAYESGDYAAALKEWRPLAENGDSDAQYNLGLMYAQGRGVERDYGKAAKWFQRAARRGHVLAAYNLAFRYLKGEGVRKDTRAAGYWLQMSAEQGHGPAQHTLGLLFANGDGVPQDFVRAYVWLTVAARRGNDVAGRDREAVAKHMTQEEIARAQGLADRMGGGEQR